MLSVKGKNWVSHKLSCTWYLFQCQNISQHVKHWELCLQKFSLILGWMCRANICVLIMKCGWYVSHLIGGIEALYPWYQISGQAIWIACLTSFLVSDVCMEDDDVMKYFLSSIKVIHEFMLSWCRLCYDLGQTFCNNEYSVGAYWNILCCSKRMFSILFVNFSSLRDQHVGKVENAGEKSTVYVEDDVHSSKGQSRIFLRFYLFSSYLHCGMFVTLCYKEKWFMLFFFFLVWTRKYRWWAEPHLCFFSIGYIVGRSGCWTLAHCLHFHWWWCVLFRRESVWTIGNWCWSGRGMETASIYLYHLYHCWNTYLG